MGLEQCSAFASEHLDIFPSRQHNDRMQLQHFSLCMLLDFLLSLLNVFSSLLSHCCFAQVKEGLAVCFVDMILQGSSALSC
jgi:hypothetical protein